MNPRTLHDIRLYGGAQGIWYDNRFTAGLGADGGGAAVAVLHTGRHYADEFDSGGLIYHYPDTTRRGKDDAEIKALRTTSELKLPIFVVTPSPGASSRRDVYFGFVEAYDDGAQIALIVFADEPAATPALSPTDDAPFDMWGGREGTRRTAVSRPSQARFKFSVLQRYGSECAVCPVTVPELLDAAHLAERRDLGSDDPRNGLVLCALHHRAFDAGLFGIDPESLAIRFAPSGPDAASLAISKASIAGAAAKPHRDALNWRWNRFTTAR